MSPKHRCDPTCLQRKKVFIFEAEFFYNVCANKTKHKTKYEQ